jgi:tripartite-type tricarboxylate transporter receptor subunit TctC
MLSRRRFVIGSALSLAAPHVARAQTWPTENVQMIVPFAPGGGTDTIGRLVAEEMSNIWRKPVIVENRPGAGSNLGIAEAARARPDGHVILIASIGFAINRFLYAQLGYDPDRDLAPVSFIARVPNILIVPNTSPAKTVAEFIALAKAEPGKLTYASAGVGSSLWLGAELFQKSAGIKLTHVPYRGSGPALQDLIAGRVDCAFDVFTAIYPQVSGGNVRGLALTGSRQIEAAGAMPTIAESGLPGFDFSTWFGLFVPSKTPNATVEIIAQAAQKAVQAPATRKKLEQLGADIVGGGPDALREHVRQEVERWGPIIRDAGIKPQ